MKKVLIIDDEQDIVELIETMIELDFETEVLKAFDGEQGIEILSQHSEFDLIISDVNMPLKGGVDVFDYNVKNQNIPVLLMTGADELTTEFKQRFKLANSLNSVLVKPWNQSDFSEQLTRILKSEQAA